MKLGNLIAATIVFVLLLIAWSVANSAPVVDFNGVPDWETLRTYGPNMIGNVFILKRNPDPSHPINCILIRRWRGLKWRITGYAYYEDKKLFIYQLVDPKGSKYILRTEPLSQEEKDFVYKMLHPTLGEKT